MDGYLKIKTKIDNSDVDKEIQKLEDKINKLQIDNSKQSEQQDSLQSEINEYEKLSQQAEEYRQTIKKLEQDKSNMRKNNPNLTVSTTPEYTNINSQLEITKQKYSNITAEIDKQAPKIQKVYSKLEQVKNKQTENNAKISEYRQQIEQINTKNIQNSVDSIGNGITGQIKKVGKLAMAVIGVRSAWMAVRGVINSVKQYNPQISTDFEYMGFAIAQVVVPAVQKLVQILYTILSYVNAITSAWFGINIFSNASVKAFQKMKAGANGTAKAMKEINKSRETFDEMNVLSDNSNSTSSTGSGVAIPSMDLSGMQGEVPAWLQWIIDNKDLVLGFLAALGTAIAALKIANFLNLANTGLGKLAKTIVKFISQNASLITGIFLIISGAILLIKSITDLIFNWDSLTDSEKKTEIALAALGVAFIALGYAIATGFSAATLGIGLLIGIIAAAVTAVIAFIAKLATEKETIKSVEDAERSLKEAQEELAEAQDNYINSVDRASDACDKLKEAQDRTGLSGEDLYKQVQDGTLDYANMTKEQKEVYKAYLDNEKAQQELKEATDNLASAKQKEKIASWENKLATMAEAGQYEEYKKAVVEAFKKGELSADEARDLIGKSMSGMSRDAQKTFMEDLPDNIKEGLDPKNYETAGQKISKWFAGLWKDIKNVFTNIGQKVGNIIVGALKAAVNSVLSTIEKVLNSPIRAINGLLGVINLVPGINLPKLNTFNLPRLAKGSVLTRPTPVIAGEAGAEAIMPLENNLEWLDVLADKLASRIGTGGGSYIIQLDSRTIQRGFAKQQKEHAFATNGR